MDELIDSAYAVSRLQAQGFPSRVQACFRVSSSCWWSFPLLDPLNFIPRVELPKIKMLTTTISSELRPPDIQGLKCVFSFSISFRLLSWGHLPWEVDLAATFRDSYEAKHCGDIMWRHHPHSTVIRPHHPLILPGDHCCSLFSVGLIRCLLSSSSPPAPPHHHHQSITAIIILPAPFQLQEHLKLFCCYRPAFLASLINQIDIDQRPDRRRQVRLYRDPCGIRVGVLLAPFTSCGVEWG